MGCVVSRDIIDISWAHFSFSSLLSLTLLLPISTPQAVAHDSSCPSHPHLLFIVCHSLSHPCPTVPRHWLLAPAIHPMSSGSQGWGQVLHCSSSLLCSPLVGICCFEVCGVVSNEVAGLGVFGKLTSWVPCYLGFLVTPWGLLNLNNPLTFHLDGEEGAGVLCIIVGSR